MKRESANKIHFNRRIKIFCNLRLEYIFDLNSKEAIMKYPTNLVLAFSLIALTILFTGCGSTEKQTGMQAQMRLTYKPEEARLLLNDFAIRYTNTIEQAADRIITASNDYRIQQRALLWKINSVTAGSEVIFIPEVYAALADTWAFCLQMMFFFDGGNGKDLFGEQQQIAVDASKKLENEIKNIIIRGLEDYDESMTSQIIVPFAQDNPIEDLSFSRNSTIHFSAKFIADRERTIATSVGGIEESVNDLSMMLNIYYQQLPKLASWRLEYLANKALMSGDIDSMQNSFTSVKNSLGKIAALSENGPLIIDTTLIKTFQQIEILRQSIKSDLQEERKLLFALLQNEREIVLGEIHKERIESFDQLKSVGSDLLPQFTNELNNSIDHFFIRLLQFTSILFIIIIVLFVLYKKRYGTNT